MYPYKLQDQNNTSSDGLEDNEPSKTFSTLTNLWRFVRPDWVIVLTGVVLYGIIGATYPIIAALIANINEVSVPTYKHHTHKYEFEILNQAPMMLFMIYVFL